MTKVNKTGKPSIEGDFGKSVTKNEKSLQKRLLCIQNRLEKSPELQAMAILNTFDFLADQGLLIDATEVNYEIKKGDFSDITMLRNFDLRSGGLLLDSKLPKLFATVCVTITITINGVRVTITVCKEF